MIFLEVILYIVRRKRLLPPSSWFRRVFGLPRDTRWRRWVMHCAVSIPGGVIGIFHSHSPGVDSVSDRNEYQEYFLGGKDGWCLRLITLSHSCVDCHGMWDPQPPGILRVSPGLYRDYFTFISTTPKLKAD